MDQPTLKSRRSIWPLLKGAFFLIVLWFVVRSGIRLWNSAPPASVQIEWTWLIPAAVLYVIGWMPSVWLWRALLLAMHQPALMWNVLRAYYVGHIGKYSPGKALVPLIRTALLKEGASNTRTVLAFIAVAYETLVFMTAGAILGLAVAPFAIEDKLWSKIPPQLGWVQDYRLAFSLTVIVVGFASTPLISWLFTKIGRGLIARRSPNQTKLPSISSGLIATGIAVCMLGWICHSLSVGFVIASIAHTGFNLNHLPLWATACTVSTVGGFLAVFAPGGLGVREGLLIEVLKGQPEIGPALSVIVACVLRLIWFLSELVVAGTLYLAGTRKES